MGLVRLLDATGIDDKGNQSGLKAIGYVFVVAAYVALAFVTTYFQAGLTAGANERLDGRDSNVKASLRAANSRLHRLLPWAVVSAKIGWYGFWSVMVFLAVLTVGFTYEWKKGALEWD